MRTDRNPIAERSAGTSAPLRARIAEFEERLKQRRSSNAEPEAEPLDAGTLLRRRMLDLVERQLPAVFKTAKLSDLPSEGHPDAAAAQEARAWADAPAGRSLVHIGGVGAGKTYAAAAQMRRIAGRDGTHVRWLTAADLFDGLRPDGALHRPSLVSAGVLVIDDIAAKQLTSWEHDTLGSLVDARWSAGRPIVTTSNLSPEQLRSVLDEMIWSRLMLGREGARTAVIEWVGPDRRRGA